MLCVALMKKKIVIISLSARIKKASMRSKVLIRISTLSFFCLFCMFAKGQQNSFELSKIIPPSPNSASLGNFGNNSKGSYNGLPQILIPLLNATVANQIINISLSYDASGTKTTQDASWVGLGWSLSHGGGAITRTVRGMDDLYTGGYHFISGLPDRKYDGRYEAEINGSTDYVNHPEDYEYFMNIRNGFYDPEPDVFTYSFGENNGKFVFDKASNGSGVVELDATNLKITYVNPGWVIIDGNGNRYFFNAQETATDYSLTSNDHDITYDAGINDLSDENLTRHPVITAWYLDSIVTATSQKIYFTYNNEEVLGLLNHSEHGYDALSLSGDCSDGCFTTSITGLGGIQHVYVASRQLLDNKLPNKIIFDNGSIEFHTDSRSDIEGIDGTYRGGHQLTDIVEKDMNGAIIKQIRFYSSYFNDNDPNNNRLKLDSIKDITDSIHPLPPYVFSYSNPNQLSPKYTKAIDHWGYFNNQLTNSTLLPAEVVTNPTLRVFSGANRLPDTAVSSLENGVLTNIKYPTGGQTKFDYELNEYTNLFGGDEYQPKDSIVDLGVLHDDDPDDVYTFTLIEPREVTFYFDYYKFDDPSYFDEFIQDYAFLESNGSILYTFHNAQP
jgi:hypothetical protein